MNASETPQGMLSAREVEDILEKAMPKGMRLPKPAHVNVAESRDESDDD
ncbi:hypothetical protein [Aeoliella mucimassa]|uniref:Uncharacterized protein n=1 Tax=Aeoliella mucimassa TaxID=2527972 RepID=A0A518AWK0_9BACT|nr:hypothetical protein [Aeoliella mucimassa]QDU59098.1 hypothetical protein Pan181_53390 [Aeoliella mucimassa]